VSDYDAWIDDALGLFPAEHAQLEKPPMPTTAWGALGVKYTKYKGVHHPCDHCVEIIHALGAGVAPHPQPATWKRMGPNGVQLLCSAHTEDHRALDRKVEDEHAAPAAHAEHLAKAKRSAI
jgi:hypothetical protein